MKKQRLTFVIGGAVLLVLVFAVFYFWIAERGAGGPWPFGKSFVISPTTIDLGDREPGTIETVTFHLTNLSKKEISVVGEKSSCSCAVSENIPVSAQPNETIPINIRAGLPRYESSYDQTVLLMVATSDKLVMSPVRITAKVPNPLPKPKEDEIGLAIQVPPESDTEAGTETQAESEAVPEPEEEGGIEPAIQLTPESDTEADTETQAESEAMPEPEAEPAVDVTEDASSLPIELPEEKDPEQ
ncbi:MAG: DUF1573 domain-containing protein [Thermoguttaceae bacterium]|jgi:hypothetical protein